VVWRRSSCTSAAMIPRRKCKELSATYLVLFVDSLMDDYTRSWQQDFVSAFDKFMEAIAKDKATQYSSTPGEFWVHYDARTRTASDRADTIRHRHQFFTQKMLGYMTPLQLKGTTPFNRGERLGGLKQSGASGHPAGCLVPARAQSPPEAAHDAPACPLLPPPAVPGERSAGPGDHAGASPRRAALAGHALWPALRGHPRATRLSPADDGRPGDGCPPPGVSRLSTPRHGRRLWCGGADGHGLAAARGPTRSTGPSAGGPARPGGPAARPGGRAVGNARGPPRVEGPGASRPLAAVAGGRHPPPP
jgi:hypothetical protein